IGAQLVALAGRGSDDDLLPADAIRVVGVAVFDIARAVECRSPQDGLEPRGPQATCARRVREGGLDRSQAHAAPVHRQVRAAREGTCVGLRIDLACLEGRDLGEVEDITNVDPRARDLDPAETVDGEVAERMSRRGDGQHERGDPGGEQREPLHAEYLTATGAHSTEKCGLRARARRNHVFATALLPRQRSTIPRWKNLTASWVPSRNERFE